MTFDGVNGAAAFGYYVGTYFGTMDGAPVELYCVDFQNEVTFGQQWDANLTPIVSGADLSGARFGTLPGALALFQQAAWLTQQFAAQPAGQYGDIQATIWQLFDPSAPAPSSSWWSQQASSNYTSEDYTDFRIVTNVPPVLEYGQVQEFLTVLPSTVAESAPSNPVPEPGTYLLIGLGLVSMSRAWRYIRI